MEACQKCGQPKISAGPLCGKCVTPTAYLKQFEKLDTDAKGLTRDITYVDSLESFDNEAPMAQAVDISAFTSGWAAGLMLAQIEYTSRMTYRKPKTRVLNVSNARTFRPHHCGTCERTRPGNV